MKTPRRPRLPLPILALGLGTLLLASVACGGAALPTSAGPTPDISLSSTVAAQSTAVARNGTAVAYLATRVAALERDAVTPQPPTVPAETLPSPVEGSVEIGGGRCCVGSTAGDTIEVPVAFAATSSAGDVTEMRVVTGGIKFDAAALADVPWEPFVSTKRYPVYVAINWTGFWVSAQFRDSAGNVSPVVYDDISVEGSPPGP